MYRCRVTKLERPRGIDIVVLKERGGKDLANKVDDGMTTSAKFTNNLKFARN
jgi:hypothetical protein